MTRSSCSRRRSPSGCSKTIRMAEATMLRARARHEVLGVAREVHPAALPPEPRSCSPTAFTSPAWSSLMTRRTPSRPRATSAADEARPGRPSSLPAASSSPSTRRSPVSADPRRDQHRHRHDPPGLADLEVRGVEPEVGIRRARERAAPERLDLGFERRADAAHLALADALDAQGLDEVVRPGGSTRPRRTPPGRPRAGRARPAGAVRAGSGSTSRREPAGSRARSCPPACPSAARGTRCGGSGGAPGRARPWAAPVSSLTSASMTACASTRTPSRRTSTSPPSVALRRVSSSAILSSAIVVSLRVVGFYVQRREDDAVAALFTASRCYTNSRDTAADSRRRDAASTFAAPEVRHPSTPARVSDWPAPGAGRRRCMRSHRNALGCARDPHD